MSWASQRRATYGIGAVLFLFAVIGGPLLHSWWTTRTPACPRGYLRSDNDPTGPCSVLDARLLSPVSTLWVRSFRVRGGLYNAVAYIQNPNADAGVSSYSYRFGLYDSNNALIAERIGIAYVMPGATTPIFEGAIDTGNRIVAHTYLETTQPLVWTRLANVAKRITVDNRTVETTELGVRINAVATNNSVYDMKDIGFIVTVYDPSGNAFAASQTVVHMLAAGKSTPITFTWPDPFAITVGSVDITPVAAPIAVLDSSL